MAKILISWVAAANDFLKPSNAVNETGPTCIVHKHFYDYDKHVLLTTAKNVMDDTKFQRLVSHLRKSFGHTVEDVPMGIESDSVIDALKISKAVNTLLLTKYKNDEIHIFISPGTPAMQVAWYLAKISLGLNIKLFQTVPPEKEKSTEGLRKWISDEHLGYISSLLVKEKASIESADTSDKLIPAILKPVYDKGSKVALADVSVLITGETGTGKELLARHIHDSSHRKKKAFIAVNCSAFGNDLLESRLFGHEKGAFTGALEKTNGLFREANGGTIFLDEIGDITPYMQQTLLRVLADGIVMRVGSHKADRINVRVIAATNKDIYGLSMEGKYRDDLYYRLAISELHLPSLKEYSRKDKELIFTFIWQNAKRDFKKPAEPKLPATIKKQLLDYSYPGNIREMKNIIYGIWAETDHEVGTDHFPKRILFPSTMNSMKLADVERNHVAKVHQSCGGNISRAAEKLGIKPQTVRSKLGLIKNR